MNEKGEGGINIYFRLEGEVYYTRRVAFIAIGIILAVILPLMLCIVCGAYRFRQKQLKEDPQWQMSLPRSRASSRTNLRQISNGPDDDSDTDQLGTIKKSRSYDKVYHTNEPLPGKPRIDFPAKKWDLDEEDFTSSEGSGNKHSKLAKDIEYINKTGEKTKQVGRRSLHSSAGQDEGTAIDEQDELDDVGSLQSPTYKRNGFTDLPNGLKQQQYSPTFSAIDSRNSGASSMSYQPNQTRYGGVAVLPNANGQFFNRTSYARPAPIVTALSQENGLPSPTHGASPTPSVQKSTEV